MLFRSAEEAIQAPLAKMLLEMDGVREVLCLSEAMLVLWIIWAVGDTC